MKSPQVLSVYEYERAEFLSPISRQTSLALNRTIDTLSRHVKGGVFERIIDKNNQTVGIRAAQFVGVIRIDSSLTIEILPKMYRHKEGLDDDRSVNVNNLFFMLDYCGQLNIPHNAQSNLHTSKGSFFETLIYIFASDLLRCMQNSSHQEYRAVEDNLPYIRGKLLINRQVLVNSANQSRFYLESDVFTPDVALNRVLKYVARMLLASSHHNGNKNLLSRILSELDDVSDVHITLQDAQRVVLTRLNDRYEQVLKMARLFLAGKSVSLSARDYESFTFLIDMNKLFEEFIATALKKSLRKHNASSLIIKTQGPVRRLVEYTSVSNDGLFRMKPDISVLHTRGGELPIMIIDTKYKMLKDGRKQGVSQSDLYQMYAYANKYQTSNIILLYPKSLVESMDPVDFYVDGNCTIGVRFVDLSYTLNRVSIEKTEWELLQLVLPNP